MADVHAEDAGPGRRAHLVLSGGGVNCIAFVGALQALERSTGAGFTWASISTCSFGTVIGALRATGMSPDAIADGIVSFETKRLRPMSPWKLVQRVVRLRRSPALYDETPIPNIFDDVTGEDSREFTLDDFEIPVVAAAVDVLARRLVVYSRAVRPQMTIDELLRVTNAIPPLYPPFDLDGRTMVDASFSWSTPIWLTAAWDDDLPIVVLRTSARPKKSIRRSGLDAMFQAQRAGITSHDT